MTYRKVHIANDNFYHVYNRGNNREKIFFSTRNYKFFLSRLQKYSNGNSLIIAYCLMPNHYHLIVRIIDNDLFTKSYKNFFISYAKAINVAMGRTGHLFEGRFKYKLIPENNYLLHLSRYIHLNPVRAGLVSRAEDWKFSSFRHYIGLERQEFIKSDIIMDQVLNYKQFVEEFQESQQYYIKKLII